MKFMKRKFQDGEFWWCEKHQQRFMLFLHDCPICKGERLDGYAKDNKPKRIRSTGQRIRISTKGC